MKEIKNNFKGNGTKWITQGLFLEVSQTPENILYTLQTWDKQKNGKPVLSLHKLYVDMADLAEYEFANKYFGNYEHWLRVKSKAFFKPYYAAMVEELNAKVRSQAINNMRKQALDGGASQSTLKYLADADYTPKQGKGRPSNETLTTELKSEAKLHAIYSNDLDRISK